MKSSKYLTDPRSVRGTERDGALERVVRTMRGEAVDVAEPDVPDTRRRDAVRLLGKLGADQNAEHIDLRDTAVVELSQFCSTVFTQKVEASDFLKHAVVVALTDEGLRAQSPAIDALGTVAVHANSATGNAATEALARVATDPQLEPETCEHALSQLDVDGVRGRPSTVVPLLSRMKSLSVPPSVLHDEERQQQDRLLLGRIVEMLRRTQTEMSDGDARLREVVIKTLKSERITETAITPEDAGSISN